MTELASLYRLAAESGIDVDQMPGGCITAFSIQLPMGKCCIAMNPDHISTQAAEKEILAHELGHCKTGAFYSDGSDPMGKARAEHRAHRWALTHLVPAPELRDLLKKEYSVDDLADHFQVSPAVICQAHSLYKDLGLL